MPQLLALPDRLRAFIAAPGRLATLATLDPDGAPRQAIVWYRKAAAAGNGPAKAALKSLGVTD